MPHDGYVGIKRFGVFSVARMAAIFGFAVGIIVLILSILVGASGLVHGLPIQLGVAIGIVLLAALIIFCFAWGAVESFLYNGIARVTRPVKIELQKNVIRRVNPISYAKVTFVFSLIVCIILALFVSSVLLAALGITVPPGGLPPTLLTAAAFVTALVLYGFVLPYLFASLYNWLAGRIGGVRITLSKGILEKIDVESYVKVMLALSVVVFVVERIIGTVVGLALNITATTPVLIAVGGFVAVVVCSLVVNALLAMFYNAVSKRYGGVEVDIGK